MRRPGAVPPADRIVRSRGLCASGSKIGPNRVPEVAFCPRPPPGVSIAPPPVPTAPPLHLLRFRPRFHRHCPRFRLRRHCPSIGSDRASIALPPVLPAPLLRCRGSAAAQCLRPFAGPGGCVSRSRPCRSSCDRGRAAYRGGGKRRVPAVSREHRRDALRRLRAYFAKPWPMPRKSSALRAAPPISPPSTSSLAKSSAAFEGLHEPP